MDGKRWSVTLLDYGELIKRQRVCFECDMETLLRFYGKDYSIPFNECIDFDYTAFIESHRMTDRLQPVHDVIATYRKYGLSVEKHTVRNWKEYKGYLYDKIRNGIPVIIHFDCFYLKWDPSYRTYHNNHTLLITGYEKNTFYIADPAFQKEGIVEEETLESASRFYYQIEGIEGYKNENHREAMARKLKVLDNERYFDKFDL